MRDDVRPAWHDLAYHGDLKGRKCPPNRRDRYPVFSHNATIKWTIPQVLTRQERSLKRQSGLWSLILLLQKEFFSRKANTLHPSTRANHRPDSASTKSSKARSVQPRLIGPRILN